MMLDGNDTNISSKGTKESSSCPRRRESSLSSNWMPAFAGMTDTSVQRSTVADRLARQWAKALPSLHQTLSRRFPQALWRGDTARNEIALTFDDGPHSKDTPALLALLAKHAVQATFFNTGTAFAANGALAHDVVAAQHQIALHGMLHQPFLHERFRPFIVGLQQLQSLLADATGLPSAQFVDVRPPYGLFTPASLMAMRQAGFRPVMWSSVPFHWHQTFDETLAQVRRELQPGAIIVLHEGMTTGPSVIALADTVIQMAKDAGYTFVTVNAMWRRR